MKIVLAPDGPLDARGTLARYHLWGEDPTNQVVGDVFRRVLRFGRRLVPYDVRWSGPVDGTRITVRVPGVHAVLGPAAGREDPRIVRLDHDLRHFYRMAKTRPPRPAMVNP